MLLIGTCRLKLAAGRSPELRKSVRAIEGHVHYPEEILQMLQYVAGETELPEPLLPLICVDICDGRLDSRDAVEQWRQESQQRFEEADTIVLEVSSFKRLPLEFDGVTRFANLNAFANSVRQGKTTSSFFRPEVAEQYRDVKAQLSTEAIFVTALTELLDRLSPRRVILVPHFQAVRSDNGKPIENRPQLRELLQRIARERELEFFDQDLIGSICGERTRIDSSHYNAMGEQVMASCLERIAAGEIDNPSMTEHLKEVARQLDAAN